MQEENRNLKDNTNKRSIDSLSVQRFFHNQQLPIFFAKKSERIASATYLVSSFFDSQEPLKWQLRSLSIELVKRTTSLSFISTIDREKALLETNRILFEIKSVLAVLHISNMISSMNYDVLLSEVEDLLSSIPDPHSMAEGQNLTKDHFLIKTSIPTVYSGLSEISGSLIEKNKRDYFIKDKISHKGQMVKKDKTNSTSYHSNGSADKSHRRDVIVSTIRKNGQVSVKDISFQIKDCSEKTLQRELLAMVDENVLKKEGERRWSRYSLRT